MREFSLFLIFSILITTTSCQEDSFNQAIFNKGIYLNFNNQFNLISKDSSNSIIIGKSIDDKTLLKIQIIRVNNRKEAFLKIKKQLKIKLMSYDISTIPYPGQMTTSAKCEPSFLPKLQKGSNFNYLYSLSNERLAPIVCQGENIHYQVGTAYYLNNDHTKFVRVEFYIEKQYGIIEINNFFKKYFRNMEIVKIDQI